MRVRTRSACVVLAWGILLIMTAVGSSGSLRPAQANIRIASNTGSTSNTTTSSIHATLISRVTNTSVGSAAGAVASGPSARAGTGTGAAAGGYVVQHGDTLSGIAAALGTPGGWPALYAANRRAIGPDPNTIHAGTVLAIRRAAPARASTGSTPPARHPASSPAPHLVPSAPPAPRPAPANRFHHPAPAHAAATAGLPRWLEIVLLAAGLLIGTAFLTEPTLAIARRRRATRPTAVSSRIVLADYDRLVVTHCGRDGNVYVLRPPGADPEAILLAARLVLAQDRYEELAGHLGVPAHWPRE